MSFTDASFDAISSSPMIIVYLAFIESAYFMCLEMLLSIKAISHDKPFFLKMVAIFCASSLAALSNGIT